MPGGGERNHRSEKISFGKTSILVDAYRYAYLASFTHLRRMRQPTKFGCFICRAGPETATTLNALYCAGVGRRYLGPDENATWHVAGRREKVMNRKGLSSQHLEAYSKPILTVIP